MIVKSIKTEKKGIYNLAYDNYTIYQLAMMVQGKLDEMGIRINVELETGIKDRRNYEVSCEKAVNELGWKPKYDIPYAVEEIWGKME
jgi:nucleoside-diphosphate-sugar epimerase